MREILKSRETFVREEMPAAEAARRIAGLGQPYKDEAVRDLATKGVATISFYQSGPFLDMCEGPHVASTAEIPRDAFKLDSIAGAYWRGDEKNKMLTRIYGLAFATKQDLEDYIARRKIAHGARPQEARAASSTCSTSRRRSARGWSSGFPTGRCSATRSRSSPRRPSSDSDTCGSPRRTLAHQELYIRSGHLAHYKESMFPPMRFEEEAGREEVFYLKPMNCPHHHWIFKSRPRSYRDLPLRMAEYGTCYRFEKSGELAGLLRVRCLTMNDAHIYCTHEQAKTEAINVMRLYKELYDVFELKNYSVRLSTHDPANNEKFHSDEELWAHSEAILREALADFGVPYEEGFGEAAFYGPKIDVQFSNLLGREETVSTVQLDYMSAERFDLTYIDEHGQEARPAVIHRAPLSTHERMLSFLIEHYGGAFPTWLAPVQVRLVAISDDLLDYANRLRDALLSDYVRVEVDDLPHSFNKKIRNAAMHKIPIILVIGRREAEAGEVTVRRYRRKEQETIPFDLFRDRLRTRDSRSRSREAGRRGGVA